jgi:hypothetical protein
MTEFVFKTDFSPQPFEVFCFLDRENRNSTWRLLSHHTLREKTGEAIRALMDDLDGLANSATLNRILEDIPDDVLMRGTRNSVHNASWTSNSHLEFFPFCSILNDSQLGRALLFIQANSVMEL